MCNTNTLNLATTVVLVCLLLSVKISLVVFEVAKSELTGSIVILRSIENGVLVVLFGYGIAYVCVLDRMIRSLEHSQNAHPIPLTSSEEEL